MCSYSFECYVIFSREVNLKVNITKTTVNTFNWSVYKRSLPDTFILCISCSFVCMYDIRTYIYPVWMFCIFLWMLEVANIYTCTYIHATYYVFGIWCDSEANFLININKHTNYHIKELLHWLSNDSPFWVSWVQSTTNVALMHP